MLVKLQTVRSKGRLPWVCPAAKQLLELMFTGLFYLHSMLKERRFREMGGGEAGLAEKADIVCALLGTPLGTS